jgi:hypothetical protein
MKPEETGTATGDLRYRTLKEMYRIVTEHDLKLETISARQQHRELIAPFNPIP